MIARAHLAALAVPLLFAGLVLGSAAVNRSDGRGPTVLTGRDVILGLRNDDRSMAEIWLAWSEPAGEVGSWLSRETLESLGFDLSVPATAAGAETHYRRQLSRRAYVAFEIAGPAWQAVLAERERAQEAGQPVPRDGLRERGSRLVPVAVGRDADVLARRYPDPRTHLISRAVVRVSRFERRGGEPYVGGMLVNVDPRRIQVPVELSADLPPRRFDENPAAAFSISLVYGSRWEPWVADVSRGDASRSSAAAGSRSPRRSARSSRRGTAFPPGSP